MITSDTTVNKLRILAVGNMYPPHHAGGYEAMWKAAIDEARSHGHAVRVLASDYHARRVAASDERDVYRTLRWYWDLDRYEFPRLTVRQRVQLERHNALELARHLAAFKPHIVAWWSMGCMSLSLIERVRRLGLPAVFVVHDDWLVYGRHHDQWIRMWRGRRRLIAPLAERVVGVPTAVDASNAGPFIFNSRSTLEHARAAGILTSRTTVIPPGIDEHFLDAASPRPWRWRLAYVGRIDRQKGLDTVVAAMAHLPAETTFSVWGTGDEGYIDELRRVAVAGGYGDRVWFEGWAEPARLRQIYADVDAVVFPVRWEEPFGLVPLEAMGMGRVVLTTARGGGIEYVEDGVNAVVIPADDAQSLAQAVLRVAEDPALRERLRAAGEHTARRYTISEFARRTVDAMVDAATSVPCAGPPAASAVAGSARRRSRAGIPIS